MYICWVRDFIGVDTDMSLQRSLHREFKIMGETSLYQAVNFITANWKGLLEADAPLFLIVTNAEEKRRSQQNKYYWAVVIRSIAEQAWVNGRKHDSESWHEYFARAYGIQKDVVMPDGNIAIKRLSTTEMTVKEFSEYTEKVTVYGATELSVRFPAEQM
jgi:hypothetical protein